MEKYFKLHTGERVDIIEHCSEILRNFPSTEILIGCDSQNGKRGCEYAVVIVFKYGRRGSHFIYNKIKYPNKIRDMFIRLFKECELSIEIAEYITKNSSFKISGIELDFNDFKKTKSTSLISSTKGWVESLGYKAILKSGNMYACKAADHIVTHPELYK